MGVFRISTEKEFSQCWGIQQDMTKPAVNLGLAMVLSPLWITRQIDEAGTRLRITARAPLRHLSPTNQLNQPN